MTDFSQVKRRGYYPKGAESHSGEDDLEPYMALFQKPLSSKKSGFSNHDLARMCKDPLHSPRLILYLIDFVKEM